MEVAAPLKQVKLQVLIQVFIEILDFQGFVYIYALA